MRPTASSLPLLAKCQWWAGEKVEGRSLAVTPEMQRGTAIHAAIEATVLGKPAPDDLDLEASEMFATWLDWWDGGRPGLEHSLAGEWQAEQAFAYRPSLDVGRSLGAIRGRAYPPTEPDEIAGTVDALLVDERARAALVIDWKTGDDRAGLTADAEDNLQLRGYALAVSRALALDEVTVAIVRIGSRGVRVTRHTFDALDLGVAAEELRQTLARVPTAQPAPGLHCRRCRAVAVCPATVEASDTIAPRVEASLEPAPDPVPLVVTADNATALLVRLRAVQAACDQVEAALKAYADGAGGIPVDGKRWKKVVTERASIRLDGPEGAEALSILETAGVGAAVEKKVTTSRAAIERVLTSHGLKGKAKTQRCEEIVADLSAAGAVRTAQVESYKETDK